MPDVLRQYAPLWRMTCFAQLVSRQTKLISFESLSATPSRRSNVASFARR
jgi:hypothetical protein